MSLRVFLAFVCFHDICQLRRAGMSCRVNIYTLSGGGSIGILPGVVPAAWGGLWRARRAVRAAPKTRNCITSRVKMWLEPLRHTTFLPVQPGGVPVTVSPLLTPPLLRLGSVGVLTSVPVALVIKREEKNKRIWDLREKRHKGVEKGDKAFLESLY